MDKETQGDVLAKLYEDLEPLKSRLRILSSLVMDQKISQYPIIILHKEKEVNLGVGVPLGNNFAWNAKLSFYEDFVKKGLIDERKREEFKKVYKDPQTHSCIFILNEAGANFVFFPL